MLKHYYKLLKDFLSIKSISTESGFFGEIKKASSWLLDQFEKHGLHTQVIHGFGNPIVLAKYDVDESLPTCLIYGHYDVQSVDMAEGWIQDPFDLLIDKEKIYGRGVADNKGQFMIHMLTVFELIKKKKLGYNILFLIEGEEESGSSSLQDFLLEYKDVLKSDFALISDSDVIGDTPCIDAGYRGACNVKLRLKTADTDVHSGSYGGVVPNPIHESSTLLSKLFDLNNRVTIPYFYYNVEEIHTDVLVKNRRMKVDFEKIKTDFGFKTILQDKEYDYLTQTGLMPTIQVTGIHSGHTGDGFKNAIPSSVTIHFNFRLVKNQQIDDVMKAFEGWVESTLAEYVDYDIKVCDKVDACKVNLGGKYHKKAETILAAIWEKKVFYKYSGGTLPIVNLFSDILETENLLIPLANEDCNAHGVNENMDIDMIEKGFQFSHEFLRK